MQDASPTSRQAKRTHFLAIAYAFPPINRSGTHRTLGFVSELDRLGWDATVLTVRPGDEPVDDALLQHVPASTKIVRTSWTDPVALAKRMLGVRAWRRVRGQRKEAPARPSTSTPADTATSTPSGFIGRLRDAISRLLLLPDSRVGWIPAAYRAGMSEIRRRRPDILYATAPYYSALIVARLLSSRTGIPFVADLRDPWHDNPFRSFPYRTLSRLDAWLERFVLSRAARVVCNTHAMADALVHRCPYLASSCTTIPNGFDAQRFSSIEPIRPEGPRETFLLLHAGQFYGPRSPLPLLAGLRQAVRTEPNIQLAFVGPDTYEGRSLAEHARQAGVQQHVRVLGPRPHGTTLSMMAGSDALVLAGATGPATSVQVPNKLYEYLAIGKPILAAVPQASPVLPYLEQARAERTVCDPTDEHQMGTAMVTMARRQHTIPEDAWSGVARFTRASRAIELAEAFRQALRGSARQTPVANAHTPVAAQ